jgi:hypothetical protein
MENLMKKLNKAWIGLGIGLVLPFLIFLAYYYLMEFDTAQVDPFSFNDIKISAGTVALIPNLVIFYFTNQKSFFEFAKGMLGVTMLYTIVLIFTVI